MQEGNLTIYTNSQCRLTARAAAHGDLLFASLWAMSSRVVCSRPRVLQERSSSRDRAVRGEADVIIQDPCFPTLTTETVMAEEEASLPLGC